MGLDGLRDVDDLDNSTSSSGSSSSSGQSGGPEEQQRVPYMVIYEDEHGDMSYAHRPQEEDLQLTFTREDRQDSWELEYTPEYIERYWMDKSSFKRAAHVVKEETGCDLRSLIQDDPEKALRAIVESSKVYQTDRELPKTEKCPVCREDLHKVFDDWQRVNGRRVCTHHTVGEIKDSGLMDRSGKPSNRMWE